MILGLIATCQSLVNNMGSLYRSDACIYTAILGNSYSVGAAIMLWKSLAHEAMQL